MFHQEPVLDCHLLVALGLETTLLQKLSTVLLSPYKFVYKGEDSRDLGGLINNSGDNKYNSLRNVCVA